MLTHVHVHANLSLIHKKSLKRSEVDIPQDFAPTIPEIVDYENVLIQQ